MFKYVIFAALLAFAAAKPKPLVVEYPVASAYTAPLAVDYAAPVYYSGYDTYATTYDYASYAYPYSYYFR